MIAHFLLGTKRPPDFCFGEDVLSLEWEGIADSMSQCTHVSQCADSSFWCFLKGL